MGTGLTAFAELSSFESLDAAARLKLGTPVAESLGADFRPLSELAGAQQMVAVEHVPSGVELVAIPGGTFDMGFTDRDFDEVKRCVDHASAEVRKWLDKIVKWSSPAHVVTASPFLLSSDVLTPAQMELWGGPRTDVLSLDNAVRLTGRLKDFRFPSEAELEYVGREGGPVSFMCDAARVWRKTHVWPHDNAWGIRSLFSAAWAADEWHDDYGGAPSTSAPWTGGGPPGAYRGCLLDIPASDEEVIYALAPCRGRVLKEKERQEDDWPVGARIARSMRL